MRGRGDVLTVNVRYTAGPVKGILGRGAAKAGMDRPLPPARPCVRPVEGRRKKTLDPNLWSRLASLRNGIRTNVQRTASNEVRRTAASDRWNRTVCTCGRISVCVAESLPSSRPCRCCSSRRCACCGRGAIGFGTLSWVRLTTLPPHGRNSSSTPTEAVSRSTSVGGRRQ
jgi:hypothetical protein